MVFEMAEGIKVLVQSIRFITKCKGCFYSLLSVFPEAKSLRVLFMNTVTRVSREYGYYIP